MRSSIVLHHPASARRWPLKIWVELSIMVFMIAGFAGCQASPKNEFVSKYKMIQNDMSEAEVDQILAGYPCIMRDLADYEKEESGGGGGPLKRKGSYVKTYDCKLGAIEGDFYIHVYFDENYEVVGKFLGEYLS